MTLVVEVRKIEGEAARRVPVIETYWQIKLPNITGVGQMVQMDLAQIE